MVEVTIDYTNMADTTYINESSQTTNYGNSLDLFAENYTTNDKRMLVKLVMPAKPAGATSKPRPTVRLTCYTGLGAGTHLLQAFKVTRVATEVLEGTGAGDGATWLTYNGSSAWDNAGGDYDQFLSQYYVATGNDAYFDCTLAGLDWGESCWVLIKYATESGGSQQRRDFRSDDYGTDTYRPKVQVKYDDTAPAAVTDLKVQLVTSDPRCARLTWTPNRDVDFVQYRIRSSATSPVLYTSTLVATITNQYQSEYSEGSANSENAMMYYAIFVEDNNNTGANSIKSNEVWMIRPDVSTFILDDATPDLFQQITATITPAALPSTPQPVSNTDYYYEWGSGAELDLSSAWIKSATRTHRYPYSGTQTVKCQVKNSLGFASNVTGLTAGGPTITVAAALPVARVRASCMLAGTGETITFYADESYCPAGNRTIKATSGYAWDWDYTGAFVADEYSDAPMATHNWGTIGTKQVALQVNDNYNWSATVVMSVTVATQTVVNLDSALVDGFDVMDYTDGRHVNVLEGPESWEIGSGTQRPRRVRISGLAYTDADVDGIPDDIETLNDIIINGKKIQITVDGTARIGLISGDLDKHKEGGYVDKVSWSCEAALE